MIKPTVYKSLSFDDVKARKGKALDATTKQKAVNTLQKFIELFKLQHT